MDIPETQATLRTRHETKKKSTSLKNIKINSTDHTKTPEVIACAR
jgi:hypothetical protein